MSSRHIEQGREQAHQNPDAAYGEDEKDGFFRHGVLYT